jgi:uncharacterized protein YjbI with pentapeptide repeats
MITSELASLIIGIEENVRPESEYYGKLVEWREKYQTWHYGIGLSDTHFFSLGTLEKQELQLLKRHDIRDFDLRILPDVKSLFESDEVIERLKYALRWLDDLPENSSQKTITGRRLAFLILTGNPDYEYSGDIKPIPPDLSYEDYLKRFAPKLQHSKLGDFLGNRKVLQHIFLSLFTFLIVVAIGLINNGYGFVPDMPWVRGILLLLLFLLVIANVAIWISNFKWSGFQKKTLWDWLQLLIIPLMLALGAFYLNSASESSRVQEQIKQEILTDYFSKMQDLIVETKKVKETSGYKESHPKDQEVMLLPEFSSTAQALTLSVLEQLDGKRKGKVITYLAESQLITITVDNNKPSTQPEIKLDGANLDDIELGNNGQRNSLNENEMTIINQIQIKNANMKRANLSGLRSRYSGLNGSNLENATLENVDFTGSIMVDLRFINGQITDVDFTDVKLGKTIFDNVKLENITISDKTNFDNACFTKIDTSNTKQEPYFLTKEYLKKLIDKKNVLEAKTYQECIRKIENAMLTGAE